MDKKKRSLTLLIISILVLTIGLTYAYYMAQVQGTGNTNAETSARTATLGEVEFNGETTFDSSTLEEIYPGFIGVQTFTIGPAKNGSGIYEVDLASTVPSQFGSDIKLTLYKTSDVTNNYITRTEGTLSQNNNGFYKQDTLATTGELTKVYEGTLSTTTETALEQVEFSIESNEFVTPDTTPDGEYTYYAIYEYINRDTSQNNQQGLNFSSKITVKYVLEIATDLSLESLEQLQALDNTLTVTTSSTLNPDFSKLAPLTSAGAVNTGYWINADYYITYASDFTYDETTGQYTLVDYTICQYSTCYNDLIGKYVIPDAYRNYGAETNTAIYQSYEATGHEVDKITSASVNGSDGSFDLIVYTGSELNEVKQGTWQPQTSGLFELQDDYGTSYYYRGNVDNNYVKFAGYYWRIIRINGDGSIRMIYAGDASTIDALANKTEVLANGYNDSSTQYTQIGTSAFNSSYNDNAYVGYMYGTAGSDNYNDTHANTNSSTIKTYLDNWYENNIKNTANEAYIADSIFCNDRSVASADTISYANTNWSSSYTTNAFGTNRTIYGAWGRQIEQFSEGLGNKATLICPNKNDAFTVRDTTKGNGALSYPIGLITIDEVNIAGGAYGENYNYYLTTGNLYWTGSPGVFNSGLADVWYVDGGGYIYYDGDVFTTAGGVRPVINLKSGSLTKGSGTASSPYEVE